MALFFRVRDPGAAVFRVGQDETSHRLSMTPLAVVNLKSGNIRDTGATPNAEEQAEIEAWIADRRREQAGLGRLERLCDDLNRAAHAVQSGEIADPSPVRDRLLLSLHDLRQALIRRQSDSDVGE